MMRKILDKLRAKAGETLVETMAAILIFTFSSIILLSMIAAASDLNRKADAFDTAIAAELNAAESQVGDSSSGTMKITYGEDTDSIRVITFSSGDGTLYSFKYNSD